MPTYAPVSSTVVQTPAILATLNDYMNDTLIPQGYTRTLMYGLCFGPAKEPGVESRPKVPIPSFMRPKQHRGYEGTQAEAILNFETSGNMQAFYDLQSLNTAINGGGTKAFTPWAHYSTYTAIARTTAKENSGAGKQFDLAKSQLEQEMRKATRTLETDLLSTNTDINHGTGQNSLVGLRHWNSTSPSSGTVHGIDRSVYIPFRNNTVSDVTSFASNGIDTMQSMWYSTSGTNGNQPVSFIATTTTIHGYIAKQMRSVHRINGDLSGGDLGVKTLNFNGVPVIHSPDWPSQRMDWINSEDLHTYVLAGCDWDMETPGKPNNVAIEGEKRWYFTPALMHLRPETNGLIVVTGA